MCFFGAHVSSFHRSSLLFRRGMGSEFAVYLRLGFEHIADLNGYDHILFIAALCAVYELREWRHLLWLVTAFTVGHSVTLALATLDVLRIDSALVEFLI